ncbi:MULTISPECIES: hypothetical protein [unclassified Streptomyces]|uniref:hypothetical protein n=1 Tax=unclassified Streptomyces TaxID=2593676 RepID=UPI001BE55741|nr:MULTISPECIES: hypothetical protein [unclassified Streptomyces]MBT2406070.1 hypothetical protein [Streptomyces sp. ISL-21]MBT2610869.1 hypothetical protein [Streptomyces sp. ISL-87]
MGLDVYAVRPGDAGVTGHATLVKLVTFSWMAPADPAPFEAVPRGAREGLWWPSDGMVFGFRGGVYQQWMQEQFEVSLYELADPVEVAELAARLEAWLAEAEAAGTAELDLGDGAPTALSAIAALSRFVTAAADQKLWLFPDY